MLGLTREISFVWTTRSVIFKTLYGITRYACLMSFAVDMLQRYQTDDQVRLYITVASYQH